MPTIITLTNGTVPDATDFMTSLNNLNQAIGTGTAITTYTTGDMPYASAANTLSKLAATTNGFALQLVSGIPAWVRTPGLRVFLSPLGATFPATNFPALTKNAGTNWVDYTLDFDQTTAESAYWWLALPTGLTVNAADIDIYSRQAAATSGTVGWTVTTLSRGEGDAWDTAGASDTVTADTVEDVAGEVHHQTKSLTITGWAADRLLLVKIARDVASDTVTEDAKLIGATLRVR